ncbi:MAG: hypothetical protein V3U54_13060 [Thermodesulfobacteriota bacterium]
MKKHLDRSDLFQLEQTSKDLTRERSETLKLVDKFFFGLDPNETTLKQGSIKTRISNGYLDIIKMVDLVVGAQKRIG